MIAERLEQPAKSAQQPPPGEHRMTPNPGETPAPNLGFERWLARCTPAALPTELKKDVFQLECSFGYRCLLRPCAKKDEAGSSCSAQKSMPVETAV